MTDAASDLSKPQDFTITPLGSALGAEVVGLDLSKELDDATLAVIEDAFHEYLVLCFRDQDLSPEDQIRFSRHFGRLEIHVNSPYLLPGHPEIYIVSNIVEGNRNIGVADAGLYFHSDLCYMKRPSRCSLLYGLEVPHIDGEPRGDTIFANCYRAYETLSDSMKRSLQTLENVQSFTNQYEARIKGGANLIALNDEQKKKVPDVLHPVVRTHPYTGRKCLFVNEYHTLCIEGMPEKASAELLDYLFEHIKKPEFVYYHKWKVGDLLLWDNCAAQHRANSKDYTWPEQRRRMHRTTVMGYEAF